MSTDRIILLCTILLLGCVNCSNAQPAMAVTSSGINGSGNRDWLVQVAPDESLFVPNGGSLAVEMAFEISGSDLVSATKNGADWPFDNPGNNPFTGTVTFGVVTDTVGDTVFASLGSNPFLTGDFVDTLFIETLGSGAATLSWDSVIAQSGVNFGFSGSVSIPEPATHLLLLTGAVVWAWNRRSSGRAVPASARCR